MHIPTGHYGCVVVLRSFAILNKRQCGSDRKNCGRLGSEENENSAVLCGDPLVTFERAVNMGSETYGIELLTSGRHRPRVEFIIAYA